MENKESTFNYSYSASEQEEIKKIRDKYVPHEETTLEKLKRLDEEATRPGKITAITVGVIGTLIFGIGMSLTLVSERSEYYFAGVVIGILGLIIMSVTKPLYINITKKRRQKIAPLILELTDEKTDD